MNRATCPTDERLTLLGRGMLAEGEATIICEHLDTCVDCRTRVESPQFTADDLLSSLRLPLLPQQHEQEPEYRSASLLIKMLAGDRKNDQNSPVPPDVVAGYQLLDRMGTGGMGSVFRARHTELDRVVAIKMLPTGIPGDHEAVARFQRETRAIGRFEHPNIVRALDAGFDGGVHYLVMELVHGLDLSQLVRRSGPLPVADVCEIGRQAAVALQHLHEHGLVHRDVKPSNLMVATDGMVKLLDLGLATLSGLASRNAELTRTGQIMGTIDYMAPEQVENTHTVDIRADIYSLGATLYRLATGRAPYNHERDATMLEKLRRMSVADPPPISSVRGDLPAEFERIVSRLLARKSDDRYTSPAEVAAELQTLCAGSDLAALVNTAVELPDPAKSPPNENSNAVNIPAKRNPARRPRTLLPWLALCAVVFFAVVVVVRTNRNTVRVTIPKDGGAVRVEVDGDLPASDTAPTTISSEPLRLLEGHSDCVFDVEFLPDGHRIVSASWDGTVRLWDVQRGTELRQLTSGRELLVSLAVSPDGSRLAAGSSSGKLRLWDTANWDGPKTIQVANSGLSDVQFAPDGATVLTVTETGTYYIYDVATGQQTRTFADSREKWQHRVAWLPDGRSFVAIDGRQSLFLQAVDRESPTRKWDLSAMGSLRAVAALPDQQHLVLGAGRLLDRRHLASDDRRNMRRSHGGDITSIRVMPNQKSLLSAGQDQTIRLIELDSEAEVQRFKADSHCTQVICVSPDGRTIVSGGGWYVGQKLTRDDDYRLRIWPVAEAANEPRTEP